MQSVLLPNSATLSDVFRPESRHDLQPADSSRAKSKKWRVIHACEYARDVLPVVEGQVAAGMRPYIVTPQGAGAAELYLAGKDLGQPDTLSLLRAWQDVRNWRKSLLECDPENSADLVHSHSFASGMAGVRNLSCVIYDLNACIEELAVSAGQCESGSWMARSFRVAEQFILSRAKAVIVHTAGMKTAAEDRSAPPDGVFVIPDPYPIDETGVALAGTNFLQERFGIAGRTTTYFLPRTLGADSHPPVFVLEAFALAALDVPDSRLLIQTSDSEPAAIKGHAQWPGVADRVICVRPNEVSAVIQNADVVIAGKDSPADPVQARHPSDICLQSLSLGKALLAADVPRNRYCSPDGRGCLWFKDGDARDLGYRMAFLGRNPDFRATLAAAGRAHMM